MKVSTAIRSREDQLIIDPYWANVIYYGRYDTGNTVDLTGINTPTVTGTLTNNTTTVKFGAAALQKASGNNNLTVAASNNTTFIMGTGDFTLEMWIYLSNAPNTNNFALFELNQNLNGSNGGMDGLSLTGQTSGTNGYKLFYYDGANSSTPALYYYGTNTNDNVSGSPLITPNTWHHVGACRVGSNLYTFVDGQVNLNSTSFTKNLASTAGGTKMGTDGYNEYGYGVIWDDVRITKGVGRYTANFVPPEKAFPTPTLS